MKKIIYILLFIFFISITLLKGNINLNDNFGSKGVVTKPTGINACALATQLVGGEEKIIVVGTNTSESKIQVVRYESTGNIDTSFGNNGIVLLPLTVNTGPAKANDVIIDEQNRIIIAGKLNDLGEGVLIRLLSDGSLDTTFNSGITASIVSKELTSIALLGDNIITTGIAADINPGKFVVESFINNGVNPGISNWTNTIVNGSSQALCIDNNDNIVAVGNSASNTMFRLARYKENGSLDTTFNSQGFKDGPTGKNASDIVCANNNKLIVAGNAPNINRLRIIRYNTNDGSLDQNFGPNNQGYLDFIQGGITPKLATSTFLPNDLILVTSAEKDGDFLLTLLRPNGTIDSSIGLPEGTSKNIALSLNGILLTGIFNKKFQLAEYGIGPSPGPTPNISEIAQAINNLYTICPIK